MLNLEENVKQIKGPSNLLQIYSKNDDNFNRQKLVTELIIKREVRQFQPIKKEEQYKDSVFYA